MIEDAHRRDVWKLRAGGTTPSNDSTANKRRTGVVGILPDEAPVIRLIGALLVEITRCSPPNAATSPPPQSPSPPKAPPN
jgi:hypothetical protein